MIILYTSHEFGNIGGESPPRIPFHFHRFGIMDEMTNTGLLIFSYHVPGARNMSHLPRVKFSVIYDGPRHTLFVVIFYPGQWPRM